MTRFLWTKSYTEHIFHLQPTDERRSSSKQLYTRPISHLKSSDSYRNSSKYLFTTEWVFCVQQKTFLIDITCTYRFVYIQKLRVSYWFWPSSCFIAQQWMKDLWHFVVNIYKVMSKCPRVFWQIKALVAYLSMYKKNVDENCKATQHDSTLYVIRVTP